MLDDDGLRSLSSLLTLLDLRLAAIADALAGNDEESWLHEHADDIVGMGLVACQRYMTEVAVRLRLPRGSALQAGPSVEGGARAVGIINAGANAWKHESEWGDPPKQRQARTVARLEVGVGDGGWDYKYANVLFSLTGEIRLRGLIVVLVGWRDDLLAELTP